jgi:hypothetical protein
MIAPPGVQPHLCVCQYARALSANGKDRKPLQLEDGGPLFSDRMDDYRSSL